MVNIKKFSEVAALDKILYKFWEKGYKNTSLDDLVKVSGVKRQSLYNAFGNKDDMYLKSLQRYFSLIDQKVGASLDLTLPLQLNIKNMLSSFADFISDANTPAGCLIANATAEFSDTRQNEINDIIKNHFLHLEEQVKHLLQNAKERLEIAENRNIDSLSRYLISNMMSIAIIYRFNRDKAYIEDIINEVIINLFNGN